MVEQLSEDIRADLWEKHFEEIQEGFVEALIAAGAADVSEDEIADMCGEHTTSLLEENCSCQAKREPFDARRGNHSGSVR